MGAERGQWTVPCLCGRRSTGLGRADRLVCVRPTPPHVAAGFSQLVRKSVFDPIQAIGTQRLWTSIRQESKRWSRELSVRWLPRENELLASDLAKAS
jgi:hypothetical protein